MKTLVIFALGVAVPLIIIGSVEVRQTDKRRIDTDSGYIIPECTFHNSVLEINRTNDCTKMYWRKK